MLRTIAATVCLVVLAACATSDPARLESMTPTQLMKQWEDWKSEPALQEMVRRNVVTESEVPLIKERAIQVGMSKNAMFAARTWCNPDYRDADGNEIYEYSGTYVKVRDDKVIDWWSVSR